MLIVITWIMVMFKSDISDGDSEDSDDHSSHLVCSQGSQWGRVWSPVETRLTAEVLDCRSPDIVMIMVMIMIMIMTAEVLDSARLTSSLWL